MSRPQNQEKDTKKMTDGGWVLLLFAILFVIVMILGFLRH